MLQKLAVMISLLIVLMPYLDIHEREIHFGRR
jgi:hypothetical protein